MVQKEQMIFRVGRRTLAMRQKEDLYEPRRRKHTENIIAEYSITPENVDAILDRMINRYI